VDSRVLIRDVRDEDRAIVHGLTRRAFAEYATTMAPAAWAGLDDAICSALASETAKQHIVAELDGVIVGSVLLFPPSVDTYPVPARAALWPELRLLAVAPETRGLGVGQLLVEECARRALLAGATALGLHTSESMHIARRMYMRLGFIRAPEFDFQPEGGELVQGFRLPLGSVA
jgi:predicted N-acetyltransferase YhbS